MSWENYFATVSSNFLYDAAFGKIPGYDTEFIVGVNPDVDNNADELIWDQGGIRVTPPVGSDFFASSDNAADTDILLAISGLDSIYDRTIDSVTLDGQNQVAFPQNLTGGFNWAQGARNIGGNLPFGSRGDVYVYTASTTTNGIPDDPSAIQLKLPVGFNFARIMSFMVPRAKAGATVALRGSTDSTNNPAMVFTRITPFGQPSIITIDYTITPDFPGFDFAMPVATAPAAFVGSVPVFTEKSILEYYTAVTNNNTRVFFSVDMLVANATEFGTS